MKKIFKEFYDLNVYIKNQKNIIIDNYNNVIYISDEQIIVDNIHIKGQKLQVSELNSIQIQIEGVIDEITFVK